MSNVFVKRVVGAYLALVALAVLAQFVAYPIYAQRGDNAAALDTWLERWRRARTWPGSARDNLDTWLVLDWLMAVGLVLMLVLTCKAKQACDADDSSTANRQWIRANVMFYTTVLVTIAFIPNWFAAAWDEGDNWTIWHILDSVIPVLFAVQARRLLRPAAA